MGYEIGAGGLCLTRTTDIVGQPRRWDCGSETKHGEDGRAPEDASQNRGGRLSVCTAHMIGTGCVAPFLNLFYFVREDRESPVSSNALCEIDY